MPKAPKKKLTIKQKKFVKEYVETGNGKQAAIKAGYKEKYAGEMAYENLRKPVIKETIEEITNRLGINIEYVLKNFKELTEFNKGKIQVPMGGGDNAIINEVMRNPTVAHKSNESLARILDVITDKIEVTGKGGKDLIAPEEKLKNLARKVAFVLAGADRKK